MIWAYHLDRPQEKILVADEEDAKRRGLVVESAEEKARFTKRKKRLDNCGTSGSHCPKTTDRRNKRLETQVYKHFKDVDGNFLRIPQNREGRKVLQDAMDRKYGAGNAAIEGDF